MPHRYFTTEIADGAAVLRGSDAHHLARVMRAKQGALAEKYGLTLAK